MKKRLLSNVCIVILFVAMILQPLSAAVADAANVVKPTKITMNKKKLSLAEGKKFKLKVKSVKPKKASKAVTYKTKNAKIASVSKKGVVKAKKVGKTVITVTSKYNKKLKVKVKVNVTSAGGANGTNGNNGTNSNNSINNGNGNNNNGTNNNNPVVTPTPGNGGTDNPSDPSKWSDTETFNIFGSDVMIPILMDEPYENTDDDEYAYRTYDQVKRAALDLRQDISMVTGAIDYYEIQNTFNDDQDREEARVEAAMKADPDKVPDFITKASDISGNTSGKAAIIIGTIGKSSLIDDMITSGKFDEAKDIAGAWEAYAIKQIVSPVNGVDRALVIAGSDARGTIYGIYTISEMIGVSPFYWYSDVPVIEKDDITLDIREPIVDDGPDVKYRGIFINDEEKSNAWAENKFTEDGKNGPGVNYYRKVFELLLRMKANTLWPAMHSCSVAFNKNTDSNGISINGKEAAAYGIIMAASHCEILLRNNVGEWQDWFNANKNKFSNVSYSNDYYKAYDFTLNRDMMIAYWRERLEANKDFESILTVGVRGPHDEAFNCEKLSNYKGNNDSERKVNFMQDVISTQREIIADVFGEENVQKVPQVLIPYKEMNDVYNAGLNQIMLWDGSEDFNQDGTIDWRDDNTDIMLMWAEDNENFLRQDITDEEAARKGGAGIYYHISYWGPPSSYLWLNSTSLYVMSEQMHRGHNVGADDYWILNVGDIKPSEPSMEFFLKMGWDPEKYDDRTVGDYLKEQAVRDYGLSDEDAKTVADAYEEYYRINGVRKAELYARGDYGTAFTQFSAVANGDESMLWLDRITAVKETLDGIYNNLDGAYKDAFYEQLYYNTQSLYNIIENWMYYAKNQVAGSQGRLGSAKVYEQLSKDAAQRIKDGLNEFASRHGNKWTGFIDYKHPGRGYCLVGDGGETYITVNNAGTGVGASCENMTSAGSGTLRFDSHYDEETHYFDVFDKNVISEDYVIETSADWIRLSAKSGSTVTEDRIKVTIDWEKVSGKQTGKIYVYNADASGNKEGSNAVATFDVVADNTAVEYGDTKGYIEANGYVAIEAEHHSEMIEGEDGSFWGVIKSNGINGDTMKALDDSAHVTTNWGDTAQLVYHVYFKNAGTYELSMKRMPILNEGSENGIARTMNVAVGVNGSNPTVLKGITKSGNWTLTLNNYEMLKTNITVNQGWNDIIVYRSDASFVFDRMEIITEKNVLQTSVLGPVESPNNIISKNVSGVGTLPKEISEYKPAISIVFSDISNVTMDINASKTISLNAYATNGQNVSYSVTSANSSKVGAVVENSSIMLTSHETAGSVTITVKASASGCTDVTRTFSVRVRDASSGGLYLESDNKLVINATDALDETAYSWTECTSPYAWEKTSDNKGVKVTPDNNSKWESGDVASAPTIYFRFNIDNAGTYYLFTNMSNPNDNADSYHVLIDGQYKYSHNSGAMVGNLIWKSAGTGISLSKGEHSIGIAAREDGLVINQIVLVTNANASFIDGTLETPSGEQGSGATPQPTSTPKPTATHAPSDKGSYIEENGLIVINVSDALENSDYAFATGDSTGNTTWVASGDGIQAAPDSGEKWLTGSWDALNGISPSIQFKVKIETAGSYAILANMSNPNNAADSYHVAVDGAFKFTAAGPAGDTWTTQDGTTPKQWLGASSTVSLSAGEHTITIFAREDGIVINQLMLTTDRSKAPESGALVTVSGREDL